MKNIFWIVIFCLSAYINVLLNDNVIKNLIVNPFYLLPFVLIIILIKVIRLKLVKFVIIFWLIYLQLGILFTTQSYLKDNFWRLSIDNTVLIYGIYLLFFVVFCIIFERYIIKNAKTGGGHIVIKVPRAISIILILFPMFWVLSIVMSIGNLPIISGTAFYDSFYTSNYGPLYGYVAYISVSIILAYNLYNKSKTRIQKSLFLLMIILFLLISIVDGKRYTILTSLISLSVYYKVCLRKTIPQYLSIIIIGLTVLLYCALHLTRTGDFDSKNLTSSVLNIPIGVEFRDFVYTENNYHPGDIKGYDFTTSSIASFFNTSLLNLWGFNKKELSSMGSAYAWENIYSDLFGTNFGIRTGIISELYFAYSYFGVLVFSIFAFFLVRISYNIEFKNSSLTNIIFCVMYALFLMIIVGQATAFIGQTMLLLYLLIIYKLLYNENLNKNNQKNY